MTYAGADGTTRDEMARVLHFPTNDALLHGSFADLRRTFDDAMTQSVKYVEQVKRSDRNAMPLTLNVANRLFGQDNYEFRSNFLAVVNENYDGSFRSLDFVKNASHATKLINGWVERQTNQRIRSLIPDGALDDQTRLVLVNAIYLKAQWAEQFSTDATRLQPFHINGREAAKVPTMLKNDQFGYAEHNGFRAITIPYRRGDFQLLILLSDSVNGLADMEAKLTSDMLTKCAQLEEYEVTLHLPKFRIEPPRIDLTAGLQAMGIKTAFDQPRGAANFDRMAPRRADDYLYLSKVFHMTYIDVDEKGTEAAAATVAMMARVTSIEEPKKPIEVKVDRPFVFAIQHRQTGACLFLGHVSDPR